MKVTESLWFLGGVGSFFGIVAAFISQLFWKFAIAFVFVLLFFPGITGFLNGAGYIKRLKNDENLCVIPEVNKEYKIPTVFCPKLVVKGQDIWGKIVLSTSSGYFLKRNGYFAYISNKEDTCAFSYYGTPVDEKKRNKDAGKKSLPLDPAIKNICYKSITKNNS